MGQMLQGVQTAEGVTASKPWFLPMKKNAERGKMVASTLAFSSAGASHKHSRKQETVLHKNGTRLLGRERSIKV